MLGADAGLPASHSKCKACGEISGQIAATGVKSAVGLCLALQAWSAERKALNLVVVGFSTPVVVVCPETFGHYSPGDTKFRNSVSDSSCKLEVRSQQIPIAMKNFKKRTVRSCITCQLVMKLEIPIPIPMDMLQKLIVRDSDSD